MASIVLICDLKILSVIFLLLFSYWEYCRAQLVYNDKKNAGLMLKTASDIIKSTYRLMDDVEFLRQENQNTAQYEIGFLMFMVFEKYRMMVDKYNTSHTMRGHLYTMELVMYLEDIENHYWEVEHITNMLHEIERKYGINSSLYSSYHELTSAEKKAILAAKLRPEPDSLEMARKKKKRKRFVISQYILDKLNPPPTKKKKKRWPRDYGWEINYAW